MARRLGTYGKSPLTVRRPLANSHVKRPARIAPGRDGAGLGQRHYQRFVSVATRSCPTGAKGAFTKRPFTLVAFIEVTRASRALNDAELGAHFQRGAEGRGEVRGTAPECRAFCWAPIMRSYVPQA